MWPIVSLRRNTGVDFLLSRSGDFNSLGREESFDEVDEMKATRVALMVFFAAGLSIGCGPDEENNGIKPTNNGNNGDMDAGNNGTNNGNNGSNNGADAGNNGGADVDVDLPPEGCEGVEIEDISQETTLERTYFPSAPGIIGACSEDVGEVNTTGAYIGKLEFPELTGLIIRTRSLMNDDGSRPPRPLAELRKGSCGEPTGTEFCATDFEFQVTLEANTPYYLVLNGDLDSNGVSIEISPQTLMCTPGESMCADGTIEICDVTGLDTNTFACPGDCFSATSCGGDSCVDAFEIQPAVDGDAVVVAGTLGQLENQWDAMERPGCTAFPDEPPVSTPGPEFFARIPGLTAGQRVIVDAEGSDGNYSFYVLSACDATECAAGFTFDPNGLNRGQYVVESDGDVNIAVEAWTGGDQKEYSVSFSVLSAP